MDFLDSNNSGYAWHSASELGSALTVTESLNFNSVENMPGFEARSAFIVNSATVFQEDVDTVPTIVDDTLSYIPWGGDNQLPFNVIDLIEKDETLATCQVFNAEVCFGSGLRYDTCFASQTVAMKSKTSCSTTTSPLISSACRRTSSTLALPFPSSSLMKMN